MNLRSLLEIKNLIFVALAIALIACLFLWRQIVQEMKTVVVATVDQKASEKQEKAGKAIELAEELLDKISASVSLPISQIDPFDSPIKLAQARLEEQAVMQQQIESELSKLKLSSISYSEKLPLAIINGTIVGEGDAIKESSFRVGKILPDRVEVHNGNDNKYPISIKR